MLLSNIPKISYIVLTSFRCLQNSNHYTELCSINTTCNKLGYFIWTKYYYMIWINTTCNKLGYFIWTKYYYMIWSNLICFSLDVISMHNVLKSKNIRIDIVLHTSGENLILGLRVQYLLYIISNYRFPFVIRAIFVF